MSMQIEIDVAYQKATKVFLSGWIATKNAIKNNNFTFFPLSDNDQSNVIFHPRNDVSEALQIPSENCTGFLLVLDLVDSEDKKFEVSWGDGKQTISLENKRFLDELVGLDTLAPDYENEVVQLLKTNGLSLQDEPAPLDENQSEETDYFDFSTGSSRVHFDHCLKLDNQTLFLTGWVVQNDSSIMSLRVKANNTISDNMLTTGLFFPRPDVAKELNLASGPDTNIGASMTVVFAEPIDTIVELLWEVNALLTHTFKLPVKAFLQDEIEFTEQLLSGLQITNSDSHEKVLANIIPALRGAWNHRVSSEHPWRVRLFGEAVAKPTLSIIIPIYARYDFVQHQMAQFSLDNEFSQIEVIYVLDDPRISHEFFVTCSGVFEMFRLPFKVVFSSINLGFSGANNLGFRFATAEHVLFINSDILPVKPNWTSKLLTQFHELDNVGILGATLLYEDNTVQHRGMQFCKDPSHDGLWMNYHPQKGFPLSLCDDFAARQVPCVTGACMLMKKELFAQLEGFDVSYILGDFEDSDLCLRVSQLGYDIYVSGKVELFHLERLSQNLGMQKPWKHTLSMVNGLLHTSRWNDVIELMMESQSE
jgi:GT2 family glycosyltransferase